MLQGIDAGGFPRECVAQLISESSAALFCHLEEGLLMDNLKPGELYVQLFAVSDCGGGTTDVTIIMVRQYGKKPGQREFVSVQVVGLSGDNALGGTDFTCVVLIWVREKLLALGVELGAAELRVVAEDLKQQLCTTHSDVTYRHTDGKEIILGFQTYVLLTKKLRARVVAVACEAVRVARIHSPRSMAETPKMTLLVVGGAHQDTVLISELEASFRTQFEQLDVVSWELQGRILMKRMVVDSCSSTSWPLTKNHACQISSTQSHFPNSRRCTNQATLGLPVHSLAWLRLARTSALFTFTHMVPPE